MPSLFSFLSERKPSIDLSKMNAEMPWLPFSLSVTATATSVLQAIACVMKFFEPLTFQPPFERTAFVRVPDASEPACDSVSPQAPKRSPLGERHEILLLLLLAAEHVDVIRAKRIVRRDRQTDGAVRHGRAPR